VAEGRGLVNIVTRSGAKISWFSVRVLAERKDERQRLPIKHGNRNAGVRRESNWQSKRPPFRYHNLAALSEAQFISSISVKESRRRNRQ
jgi:hypothetical protein